MQQVRIELVPRMVDVDRDTYAARSEVVQRLGELGHINPTDGEVPATMQDGWLARINGVEVPVVTYGVEPPAERSRPLVSLLIAADSVQVGDPSAGTSPAQVRPAAPPKNERSTWGSPGRSDPRESIPGWRPDTLGQQVAENAATVAS